MFTLLGRRQETVQELELGLGADGRLAAIVHHGFWARPSTHADYFLGFHGRGLALLYACPNVATGHRLVRTNEPQPVPMRAPGTAPGTFALESALDEAAERLGIDPVELRVRNFADHDQEAGRPWSSNSLLECYRVGAERFGWSRRPTLRRGRADGALADRLGGRIAPPPSIRRTARLAAALGAAGRRRQPAGSSAGPRTWARAPIPCLARWPPRASGRAGWRTSPSSFGRHLVASRGRSPAGRK